MSSSHDERAAAIETIARTVLSIETLATRHSDRLDFHEVAVWSLQRALELAYEAGLAVNAERLLRDIPKPPRRTDGGSR
jgi:hypothetical protein